MNIRRYRPEDAPAVDEIYDKHHKGTFGRPNLSHVLSAIIIEDDTGKIIGFGCLELIVEAVAIIDMDLPSAERVEMLRQFSDVAKFVTKDKTFERFYMFPSDEHFKDVLVGKFGMKLCSPILSCEVDSEQKEET